MARFASAAELESFLRNLEPDYAQYASALWQHQVRTANQLANASKSLLLSWGLLELHVDDIKARANSAGRNSTEDEAGPSKKPRTGHISETPLTEQSELLVDQYLFKPLPDSFLPSTGSQVLQWLFDFTEMKVPVTPLFYQQMLTLQGPQQYLSRKRVDLSGMHYGPVKFMLGYAAAGTTVQWCFLPDHADQPVQVMGDRLDVRSAKGRMSFLLSLVQAYRLLAVMSAAVPPLPGRWPLYSEIERENSIYVSYMT
ncbi:hypothetical protein WJX77_004794 [Trebouxia sp. C0004]